MVFSSNSSLNSTSSVLAPQTPSLPEPPTDKLIIAGRTFNSRLMTGTGKYSSLELMQQSIAASGSQIVTVAVRRVQPKHPDMKDWQRRWIGRKFGCYRTQPGVKRRKKPCGWRA
jgi:thiazole synthase